MGQTFPVELSDVRGNQMTSAAAGFDSWFKTQTGHLVELLLARDENGPHFRTQAVAAFLVLIWFGAALVEHPAPDPARLAAWLEGAPAGVALVVKPFLIVILALIHPHVLRHLVLPIFLLWAGLRAGARYLDDLFELNDFSSAQAYMRSTLFGAFYDVLEVKDGDVTPESKLSPVYKIGGPGYLKIHLGNAALFERVGGTSTICGATQRQFLHGFERLREVVDLRDQIRKRDDMEVYTKDGIAVKATDIQVAFRLRSDKQTRDKDNPYPFDKKAVRRVVYGKAVGADRAPRWDESVAAMASGAVTRYIGSRLLKDLIAQKTKVGVTPPGQAEVVSSGHATPEKPVSRAEALANARRALSLSFYEEKTAKRFEEAGVELIWIGVGTLSTPEDVTQEWINAWHADIIARIKSSKINLEEQRRSGRARIIERLLGDVGDWWILNTTSASFVRSALSRKSTAGTGANATILGKAEPVVLDDRSPGFYILSQEDDRRATDMLNLYVMKFQELRQGLDPHLLPPKTDEALAYIGKLPGPKIIGDDGDTS